MSYLMIISMTLGLLTNCLLVYNEYMIMHKIPIKVIINRRIYRLEVKKAKLEEKINILSEQEFTSKIQKKIDKLENEIDIISCKLVILHEYINKKPSDC